MCHIRTFSIFIFHLKQPSVKTGYNQNFAKAKILEIFCRNLGDRPLTCRKAPLLPWERCVCPPAASSNHRILPGAQTIYYDLCDVIQGDGGRCAIKEGLHRRGCEASGTLSVPFQALILRVPGEYSPFHTPRAPLLPQETSYLTPLAHAG